MHKTIAIIGGGAAGMMTAATILEQDDFVGEVLLFEKNKRLGAKVIISGGGRCNVTTGVFKRKELKTHYTRGGEFLDIAFRGFSPKQVRAWFEAHGVPLKQEDDGRIFPISDDGKDIVGVFEDIFEQDMRINIYYSEGVIDITRQETGFVMTTDKKTYEIDVVVLTTGGNAYAHTGSSGDGYAFARACGHTITPLGPSLNSFMTKEKRLHALSGLSFEDAVLKVALSDGVKKEARGPVLLTHFGLSGPATFVIASHAAFEPITSEQPCSLFLQPLGTMDVPTWESWLLEQITLSPKKELQTILSILLPKRFIISLLAELGLQATMQVSTLTKGQRTQITQALGSGINITAIKRRPGDEFVTAGGVSLDEIDAQTMESRVCPGLYFAGEIMDVDGVTGGFNLQASWAAGRLVGKYIVS